jgi:hypothetical protein
VRDKNYLQICRLKRIDMSGENRFFSATNKTRPEINNICAVANYNGGRRA